MAGPRLKNMAPRACRERGAAARGQSSSPDDGRVHAGQLKVKASGRQESGLESAGSGQPKNKPGEREPSGSFSPGPVARGVSGRTIFLLSKSAGPLFPRLTTADNAIGGSDNTIESGPGSTRREHDAGMASGEIKGNDGTRRGDGRRPTAGISVVARAADVKKRPRRPGSWPGSAREAKLMVGVTKLKVGVAPNAR
jgi:hypothetical protein